MKGLCSQAMLLLSISLARASRQRLLEMLLLSTLVVEVAPAMWLAQLLRWMLLLQFLMVQPVGQIYGSYYFEIAFAGGASNRGLKLKYDASNSFQLQAPSSGGNNTYIWPAGPGSSGYALTTNGSGTLSWTAVGGGGGSPNLDGGAPNSSYLAIDPIDGGTP
jgi:hypothetical protein